MLSLFFMFYGWGNKQNYSKEIMKHYKNALVKDVAHPSALVSVPGFAC